MNFGHKKLYIAGELIDAAHNKRFTLIAPGDERNIGTIAWAGAADTQRALTAAQKGFEQWSILPLDVRLEWITKLREALIQKQETLRASIMYEMGKVWEGTEEDYNSLINSLEFYKEEISKRDDIIIPDKEGTHSHRVVQQPLGVVVAFLAYNFPLLNLGFKLGPALAAGCSIVLKPSEYSPLSAYIIGEVCHEIGFPKGVINVLCGDVHEVGIPLCESTIPKLITMIGSTETAQKLIAQSSKTSIKRYSMECGGNAPFIVFADADIDAAMDLAVGLKIGNTGQICVAANRYYIHESIIDSFVNEMKDRFEKVNIGFGRENKPEMGPLANKRSVHKMEKIVADALAQGGRLITGGKALNRKGYYFSPTIIAFDHNDADILKEEVFGPVAFVTSFTTKEEVLELSNSTDAGLASYVFSKDEEVLEYFAQNLEFGEVQLNGVKYDIYLPHGGVKNSGIGVDCSSFALDDYLIRKRVSKALSYSS